MDTLLHYAGTKVQSIFANLPPRPPPETNWGPLASGYVPAPKDDYEDAVERLQNFFAPKRNDGYERHVFRQMKQKPNERIDVFAMRLRMQAEKCCFENQLETNIIDQITSGCLSNEIRRKILSSKGDLNEIMNLVRIEETVAIQQKLFTNDVDGNATAPQPSAAEVCKIGNSGNLNKQRRSFNNQRQPFRSSNIECSRCGYNGHKASDENCPAKNKACNKCGKQGHFAQKCRTNLKRKFDGNGIKSEGRNRDDTNEVRSVENDDRAKAETEYDDVFCIDSSDQTNVIWCKIGNVEVKTLIDSGSKHNIVDRDSWIELKAKNVQTIMRKKDADRSFNAYGGTGLRPLGMFEAQIEIGQCKAKATFYVVNEIGNILLGRETATALNVLKIGYDINAVLDQQFNKIRGIVVEIPIKVDAQAVIQPYRRIPAPLEKAVDDQIDDLLKKGIIEEVKGVSRWVSPMVVVPKKDGDVRICVDMRRANEAVDRENHPLPTIEDFLPQLGQAQYFSKLDIKQAFHQVSN